MDGAKASVRASFFGDSKIYVVAGLHQSYLASMSGVVCVVCPFADDEKLKNIHVDPALLV